MDPPANMLDLKGPELQHSSESDESLGLELNHSTGPSESEITSIHPSCSQTELGVQMPLAEGGAANVDELPLQTLPNEEAGSFFNQIPNSYPTPIVPDHSSSVITIPESSVTGTSGITQPRQPHQRSSSSKLYRVEGCVKGARGASGLCLSHGGGRRCQKPGCHKGAEGRTVYCKAHGGGRRCQFLGCTKSAEGRTEFCIGHGGGRRCSREDCTRAARGKSGLCIRHGGGKRCQKENCTKSAEGLSGLCISHGGGRRCQAPGCTKGAQGSTMFCKRHGGGIRCTAPGCTKAAEGSTPFCQGHGGGIKRKVTLEKVFIITNFVLEVLLIIFDQLDSPQKPQFALIALVITLAAMLTCVIEIVCRGWKQNVAWMMQPLFSRFIDVFSLTSAFSQFVFTTIAYCYIHRGANSPIKLSMVSLLFIICYAVLKFMDKPNEAAPDSSRLTIE